MKFVTSIGPARPERTKHCVDSWQRLGAEVVSVQVPGDDVSSLRESYPGVMFTFDNRTGEGVGKPQMPRLSALLSVDCCDPFLLINSDIEILGTRDQFEGAWKPEPKVLKVGVRYDTSGHEVTLNPYGIDAFLILPEMLSHLSDDLGFCIGFPGWDYWLPYQMHLSGYKTRRAESILHHEVHDVGYPRSAIAQAQAMLSGAYKVHRRVFTEFVQRETGRQHLTRKKRRR